MAKSNGSFSLGRTWVVSAAALFLFTLMLYASSFRAGYIWDDDMLVENALVNGGWPGLKTIWSSTKYPDFCPLTATSFWLEAQLGGATAAVRHTTNIILQGFNVVLLWLVLRALKIPGAWIAAAIFAAHPLCVTSVTWVAERKNTQSMFFYLLSFVLFLRAQSNAGSRYCLIASVFCYVAAVLSKTSTVVLPVVFLLCAWWRSGNISRADILPTLPFFGIALAGGGTTLFAHYYFGDKAIVYDNQLERMLAGAKAVWFYLGKAFAPVNLTMHYPRWEMDAGKLVSYWPALVLIALFAVFWAFRKSWGKACLFGLGYFVIALAPTLGIAKMTFLKFSQVADHFQYLALPGLIALAVGGVYGLVESKAASKRALYICQTVLFAGVLLALAVLSWKHQRIIGDAETMWRDNLQKNPQSWLAHYGLTTICEARGEIQEVEMHYRKAIEIRPHYIDALSNLGVLLGRQGRWTEAIECYRKAISFEPTAAMIHFNLGMALMSQNRFIEALGSLNKAVELRPNYSRFRNSLANVLIKTGRREEAFQQVREAIRLDPKNDEAQANLGLMLWQDGKAAEAEAQFQNALKVNPANAQAHYRLATLFAALGKGEEALSHLAIVARLQPENAQARTVMAEILRRQGKTQEAARHQAAANALLQGRNVGK